MLGCSGSVVRTPAAFRADFAEIVSPKGSNKSTTSESWPAAFCASPSARPAEDMNACQKLTAIGCGASRSVPGRVHRPMPCPRQTRPIVHARRSHPPTRQHRNTASVDRRSIPNWMLSLSSISGINHLAYSRTARQTCLHLVADAQSIEEVSSSKSCTQDRKLAAAFYRTTSKAFGMA